MSPMALDTDRPPPTLIVSPTGKISPYLETILLYSSILVGVCSEVTSKTWLSLTKIAVESPMLAIVKAPFLIQAKRHVVPSEYCCYCASLRNCLSRSLQTKGKTLQISNRYLL